MTSTSFFFLFIPLLAVIFLAVNLILAPHNPYQEKDSTFECGFHSFLGQNRSEFSISFFIFGLLFLLFDIEILLVYPFFVSAYNNGIYGLIIALILLTLLTVGFVFEIGKNALKIDSRQYNNVTNTNEVAKSGYDTVIPSVINYGSEVLDAINNIPKCGLVIGQNLVFPPMCGIPNFDDTPIKGGSCNHAQNQFNMLDIFSLSDSIPLLCVIPIILLIGILMIGGKGKEKEISWPVPGSMGPPPRPRPGQTFNPYPGQSFNPQPGQNYGPQPGQTYTPQPGQSYGPQPGQIFSPYPGQTFGPAMSPPPRPQPLEPRLPPIWPPTHMFPPGLHPHPESPPITLVQPQPQPKPKEEQEENLILPAPFPRPKPGQPIVGSESVNKPMPKLPEKEPLDPDWDPFADKWNHYYTDGRKIPDSCGWIVREHGTGGHRTAWATEAEAKAREAEIQREMNAWKPDPKNKEYFYRNKNFWNDKRLQDRLYIEPR